MKRFFNNEIIAYSASGLFGLLIGIFVAMNISAKKTSIPVESEESIPENYFDDTLTLASLTSHSFPPTVWMPAWAMHILGWKWGGINRVTYLSDSSIQFLSHTQSEMVKKTLDAFVSHARQVETRVASRQQTSKETTVVVIKADKTEGSSEFSKLEQALHKILKTNGLINLFVPKIINDVKNLFPYTVGIDKHATLKVTQNGGVNFSLYTNDANITSGSNCIPEEHQHLFPDYKKTEP